MSFDSNLLSFSGRILQAEKIHQGGKTVRQFFSCQPHQIWVWFTVKQENPVTWQSALTSSPHLSSHLHSVNSKERGGRQGPVACPHSCRGNSAEGWHYLFLMAELLKLRYRRTNCDWVGILSAPKVGFYTENFQFIWLHFCLDHLLEGSI